MSLEGKLALVTGASRGIGQAIAAELAKQGAKVVGTATTDAGAAGISQTGLIGKTLNVRDSAQCDALVEAVQKEQGDILILVNNAGVTRDGLSMRMPVEDWDTVLNTNLKGAFNFAQALMRPMIRQRSGRIINISSVIGLIGNAGQANYAASKAGLIGLTKSLARELASRGITVNAIAPGLIETDMTGVLSEEIRQAILQKIPLGQLGQPDDIAAAVAYLASAEGRYITGQVLAVDGGMVM